MAKQAASKPDKQTIRVFIASPGDLTVERRAFKEVIDELNGDFAEGAKVEFVAVCWEDTISPVGRRPQSEFNEAVNKCDVFILAMFKRWGQKVPDITPPATSYTEEEFNLALKRWNETQQEPIIHVLFKKIDAAFLVDPGVQLKKVLKFKKKLERSGQALTIPFEDEAAFRQQLHPLLKDAAHRIMDGDREPAPPVALRSVPLPEERLRELEAELSAAQKLREKLEAELLKLKQRPVGKQAPKATAQRVTQTTRAQTKLALAKREQAALRLAEKAAKAALEGRVEEARQDFAQATDSTTNLQVLYLAFEFYNRTGDLATAEELVERWLALSGRHAETADTANALGNLGLIYQTRGDLNRAEEIYHELLSIEEKLRRPKSIANAYGNLGVIYQERGELDQAEEMHLKSLDIEKKFGDQSRMASQYCNLGMLYEKRGDLKRAEEMLQKALAIDKKLRNQEGMASDYGNLGLIYGVRGELERAEEMHRKALAIEEKLDHQEGIASQIANLGSVAKDRGEFERARELWTKARDLFAKIGMPHMVKQMQGCLDRLPQGGGTE